MSAQNVLQKYLIKDVVDIVNEYLIIDKELVKLYYQVVLVDLNWEFVMSNYTNKIMDQ